jgi:hypothetical protein
LDIHASVQAGAAVDVVARHGEVHGRNATGFFGACQPGQGSRHNGKEAPCFPVITS